MRLSQCLFFFWYFGLHIQGTISYRGYGLVQRLFANKLALLINKFLNYLIKKFIRVENKIAYGGCLDCNFISLWPELSDESLLDYYSFYLTDEYRRERGLVDPAYSLIEKNHGSVNELLMRRKQNEDFIVPILEEYLANLRLDSLRMLDYGGGSGQVAPLFDWIDVDIYDVDHKSIRSRSKKSSSERSFSPAGKFNALYDFVQLLHVIEHVGNPLNTVKSAVEYLKTDGLLLVEVPWEMLNFDDLSESGIIVCDEHINKFCDHSLTTMMKNLGLKVLLCEGAFIAIEHIDTPFKVIRCLAQKK
jgi:SAM-dependent methyltransferase